MATPRKDKKIRDSEATKRTLMDCVGEIVRSEGFHLLGVNKIARLAEKDKGVIRYHFGGLGNLIRAYIKRKDYWPPFFERYKIDGTSDQGEVKEMFTALMQENLKQFYNDKEMQKIILWQITKGNPVLRQISEEREDEGQKLFELTDPTFLHSGVSFKAVIALLLGGSYFAVLQAHSIKTRVAGVDVNWEKDFKVMQKTIEQIISWAYEKANTATKSKEIPMNVILENLEKLTEELKNKPAPDRNSITDELSNEAAKVERTLSNHLLSLTNETQISTFLQLYLSRLVKICDLLYDESDKENKNANIILELIDAIRLPVAAYVPENIILPKLFRQREGSKAKIHWSFISKRFAESGIDEKLIEIMYAPIERFAEDVQKMKWNDYKYLRRYVLVLQELTDSFFNLEILLETLVGLGLNLARFGAFYTDRILERLQDADQPGRKNILLEAKSRLVQISIYTKRKYDMYKQPILEELEKWIDGQLLKESGLTASANPLKFTTKLTAVQLALWSKLQYDHGVFDEDNLDILSEKIVYNFSTKSQSSLSPQSMKSKLYPKDTPTVQAIRKILKEMSDDLDNFF